MKLIHILNIVWLSLIMDAKFNDNANTIIEVIEINIHEKWMIGLEHY